MTDNPLCGRCFITGSTPIYQTQYSTTDAIMYYPELKWTCSGTCSLDPNTQCFPSAPSCVNYSVGDQGCE